VAPIDKLVNVPEGIDSKTAAAAMLQGMTAHYLAQSTYHLTADDTCVVHAAAGGVGLLLCQMAKHVGARIIGVVSTEEKAKLARGAGADHLVLSAQADFCAAALEFSGGRGVDVVYDSVGRDTFERSLRSLRRRGMLVLYGQSSGPVPPVDLQILSQRGSLFLTRPTLGDYVATPQELRSRAEALFSAIRRGELYITIGATFALADAAKAHSALQGRATVGKLLLTP
jgi:NADPH2:quinone reductase